MAIIVTHSKVSTIPDGDDSSLIRPSDWNDDHVLVGLGTAAELDAGVANGVATLDSGGKVPISELPAAVLGALSYQGTWNATTNSPTLTSSVGTKGYYYVVSVAGTTNLNGITDWQVGDWAVYNGTVWQKVDNTDAGGDVVGPSSATDYAIARFDGTTGKLIQNSGVLIDDLNNVVNPLSIEFSGATPTTPSSGTLYFDGATDTLNITQGAVTQQIGEEIYIYGKASAAITEGQLICKTGTVGASGVITFAPSPANLADNDGIIGIATENIAHNAFGRITYFGVVHGINTSGSSSGQTWADNDTLWYNPVGGGLLTNVKPTAPNIKFAVATVINAGSGGSGSVQVLLQPGTILGGTDSNVQINGATAAQILTYDSGNSYWKNTSLASGTGISTTTNTNGTLTVNNTGVTSAVAGTGISVSGATGAVTITNSAPDQTVSITGGGTTTVTGTYPNFTVTSNDQYVGTVTSVSGTGSVNGITLTGTVTSSGSLTLGGTLGSIANSQLTNSAVTINGTSVSLGGSATITAANPNALTIGTYLTGTSYNGSAAVTIAADATSTNTASKLVARDANGDFAAGVITATKYVGVSGGTF